MKKITILGSTGSIGCSALDVIGKNPERFQVVALAAGKNIALLKKQIEKFKPKVVAVSTKETALQLHDSLTNKNKVKIFYDKEGLKEVASFPSADVVISAISGSAGLIPTIAAIEAGKDIALANKETMVMAGEIVTRRAIKKRVKIIPIDSEHSAIFQCLEGQKRENLRRIILTASGGPFLNITRNELKKVSLSQTLRHPNWKMGKKVTIDSASMMNKGLEVIEAKWFFNVDFSHIDVLIHPQSIVHSMVEFVDGAFLAQMGIPDMKLPIAYALTYPERIINDLPSLNLVKTGNLEFRNPDIKKFPCLGLAYAAGICGGTAPVVLNAADEIAVAAFMEKKVRFIDLPKIIETVLDVHNSINTPSLEDILQADLWARRETSKIIERIM
ncbi:MAG: 1-deoxy-D-xylulose-5-phosphate reductoisomerase [Deltaproteobacteria bacterium HGW-Deltaproteobacteria-2]|jgi:1-deoxy-D-xylulose-5-phosphate reductoisomerase|nr:MAG: 1-deoxy-D-xylulose-5-phosphate reductoisomerase [Deltaproteobacteria bacterium HGW-Deltaproteobacteria-2]